MTSILRTKKAIFNIIACFFLLLLLFQLFQLNPIPVNQDEFLPVFSKSFLEKSDFAKGSLSQPYSKSIFGKNFPVISYPYVGSLKGLLPAWPYSSIGKLCRQFSPWKQTDKSLFYWVSFWGYIIFSACTDR